jgi:hypothetical protein
MNFFANKFTGLRGGRFAFLRIFTGAFYGLFFRHTQLLILKSSLLILTVDIRWGGLPSGKDRKGIGSRAFADSDNTEPVACRCDLFVLNCFGWLAATSPTCHRGAPSNAQLGAVDRPRAAATFSTTSMADLGTAGFSLATNRGRFRCAW